MMRLVLNAAALRLSQRHLWAVLQKRHEGRLEPFRAVVASFGGKVEPLATQPAMKTVSAAGHHFWRLSCALSDAPADDL